MSTQNNRLIVGFDHRNHNPILRVSAFDSDTPPNPWLGPPRIEFT
jgi:hypothetical protein